MKPGDIIEFESGGEHYIGAVVRLLGGGKKLVVHTREGRMRTTPKKVSFETGRAVRDAETDALIEGELERVERAVAEHAGEVDVAMIWEFVRDGEEEVSAREVAQLFFDDDAPAVVLAVSRALRAGGVYFKSRREGFEPRSPGAVEEMLRQQRIAEQKEQERQGFIGDVVEVLSAGAEERAALAEAKMADELFRQRARVLQKYALHGSEAPQSERAEGLLEAIGGAMGRGLRGRDGLKAFWLMVEMGVWDEHENLELLRHHIATGFAEETHEEAKALADRGWQPSEERVDLSGVLTFSVDAASTRDIDDALSVEARPEGGWRVGVHVADPSARVEAGSVLDEAARGRGTSIYLPTGTLPMFPAELSHGPLSLVAGELRPAMSTIIECDAEWSVVGAEVVASVVRVDQRLTYDEVDARLAAPSVAPLDEALGRLSEAAECLAEARRAAGAVDIRLPELQLKVELGASEPVVLTEVLEAGSRARQMVSEWMVQANHAVGVFCRTHDIPMIYRAQDPPEGEVYTEELLAMPEGPAREFAKIYKMKPGEITREPRAHFGLGLSVYVQASSPIRRYGDLVCQRQIKAFLRGQPLPYGAEDMLALMGSVESSADHAKRAERETKRYWTIYHLSTLAGESLEATVLDHKDHDEATAAVFVHALALKANARFRKRPPVGAVAEVRVKRADARRDVLHLNG